MKNKNPRSIEEIKKLIDESNRVSFNVNQNQYVIQEQATLSEIWERVPCTCDEDCTCKICGCTHHWKIRDDLSFEDILPGFLRMFVSKPQHGRLLNLLNSQSPDLSQLSSRNKGAYEILEQCRDTWDEIYPEAVANDRTILCDDWASPYWHEQWQFMIQASVFKAKMMSLLMPDTAIPYDTYSRKKLQNEFCLSQDVSYFDLLTNLRKYCIYLLESNNLSLEEFRALDKPGIHGIIFPGMITLPRAKFPYGNQFSPKERPLSRVVDKIYYKP